MTIPASRANAAHLLRRAAWGGRREEIDAVAAEGIDAAVDRLLDAAKAPSLVEPASMSGFFPYEHEALVAWFARLCVDSPTPAIERLLWFWHGHFATSIEKVEFPDLMVQQFATMRRWGLGPFEDLLLAMAHDPAMIMWLDLQLSVLGNPNENFARELLELFSMGAGNGYVQRDVVEAARAFTGHTIALDTVYERPVGGPTHVNAALHDFGPKTFLGRSGPLGSSDIIAIVVERPECHRFLAQRLWLRYAGTPPPVKVVDDLAAAFGRRHHIRDVLTVLLTHPEFYTESVKEGLVAQPFEVAIRAIRGFEIEWPDVIEHTLESIDDDEERLLRNGAWHPADVAEWVWMFGQVPMLPPNVGGWPHNEAWLDSNRAAARLLAGTHFGHMVVEAGGDVAETLHRTARRGGADLTSELMARFGRISWTSETEAAITDALGSATEESLAAAIAVAFTSPEVTLA
ncbi:MAG: DUF1800 domain-containing protein [Actinomycetota bacterium]